MGKATIQDGSEYRGDYGAGDQTLYDFRRRRMEILVASGASPVSYKGYK